ncbi:MAG: VTT domain-containing protein [Sporolactobacillus sp.]
MSGLMWGVDVFLHIDKFLTQIVNQYGSLTYALLFAVIFIETGVVICPFLPGESMLFAAGAIAAQQAAGLNIGWLIVLIAVAAVLGDTVNYWVGRKVGRTLEKHRLFRRLINAEKMAKAEAFFDRYGGMAIFLGRFVPFIRTFVPFIAGGSRMNYMFFFTYNVLGGATWTLAGLLAGYFFGGIGVVKDHFSLIMLAIVAVSLLPIMCVWLKKRFGHVFNE